MLIGYECCMLAGFGKIEPVCMRPCYKMLFNNIQSFDSKYLWAVIALAKMRCFVEEYQVQNR